jgi:isopenicillin N synthase-like dioxygenase
MELPVVSLTRWDDPGTDRQQFAADIAQACHKVGFLTLTDHGVPQATIDGFMDLLKRFFALPAETKALIEKTNSRYFRGWERVGSELTDNRVDYREQIDLSSEHEPYAIDVEPVYLRLQGPNQWLSDEVMPGFREAVSRWFTSMEHLANRLMEILAVGLGLEDQTFRQLFGENHHSLMKMIHYPPTPIGQAGVNAHQDAGFLTILLQYEVGGLQVKTQEGQWVEVPVIPGTFVLNIGEMLQAMTGNYYVATMHRVISSEERFSTAFFHGPDLRTRLDPLQLDSRFIDAVNKSPFHQGAGFMAKREELIAGVGGVSSKSAAVFGEQLWNYYSRSYPDIVRQHSASNIAH